MKTILLSATLAFATMFGAAGCGSDTNHCKVLAKKLCDGKDDAQCKKTSEWLDKQMTGPDGEKLSKKEANAGCKMILDDSRSLAAYKKQAARKVK